MTRGHVQEKEGSSRFLVGTFSQFRQRAGEDLQPEVLLIPQSIGPPLDGPDLVIDALHEAEGHFVLRTAIGLDPIPVAFDHAGEALEGLQPLPAQAVLPLLEETPCPPGAPVVPELIERLL